MTPPTCDFNSLPSLLSNGHRGQSGRGVQLTINLRLGLRLRMRGAIPPLSHTSLWRGTSLNPGTLPSPLLAHNCSIEIWYSSIISSQFNSPNLNDRNVAQVIYSDTGINATGTYHSPEFPERATHWKRLSSASHYSNMVTLSWCRTKDFTLINWLLKNIRKIFLYEVQSPQFREFAIRGRSPDNAMSPRPFAKLSQFQRLAIIRETYRETHHLFILYFPCTQVS
jgi:hypothetical protein